MKIRNGFVSNSSSSSFMCDVCGETISGWDVSISDYDMYECQNGHYFHEHEMNTVDTTEQKRVWWIADTEEKIKKWSQRMADNPNDDDYIRWRQEEKDILVEINDADDETLEEMFEERVEAEGHYEYPSCYCPICSMSELKDDECNKYLQMKYDIDFSELKEEIKGKFKTYNEFHEYLNGDKNED